MLTRQDGHIDMTNYEHNPIIYQVTLEIGCSLSTVVRNLRIRSVRDIKRREYY